MREWEANFFLKTDIEGELSLIDESYENSFHLPGHQEATSGIDVFFDKTKENNLLSFNPSTKTNKKY
jgi:hypothetical protein